MTNEKPRQGDEDERGKSATLQPQPSGGQNPEPGKSLSVRRVSLGRCKDVWPRMAWRWNANQQCETAWSIRCTSWFADWDQLRCCNQAQVIYSESWLVPSRILPAAAPRTKT